MSRSRLNPSVTPLIAFWARARASPWNARCWRSSFARWHDSSCPLSANLIPGGTGVLSWPLGPCTSTEPSETDTFTPGGTTMTLRPTRDIVGSLPDVAEDLAPHPGLRGLAAGHDAPGGGEDVDAEAAVDAGDLALAALDPAAGAAHPLQVGDDPLPAGAVLQEDPDRPLPAVVDEPVVGDVPLVLEDARDLGLEPRRRHVDLGQPRPHPVPDAGDHVRDGIRHVHRTYLSGLYQLALITPGISPAKASFRKQIRHISNLRM